LEFLNPDGTAAAVSIEGQTSSSFPYSLPARSSRKLSTAGARAGITTGSIRVIPTAGALPSSFVIFSYKPAGITVSEAAVSATAATALRMYVESSGAPGETGNINSGVAVANVSPSAATVTFDLTQLDGRPVPGLTPVAISMAGSGQLAKFLTELFPTLANTFKGVLRITTDSEGASIVALRTHYNERGDFLITTIPAAVESSLATSAEM